MPTLTIDNQQITVPHETTILEAARQLGIHIPTLCVLDKHESAAIAKELSAEGKGDYSAALKDHDEFTSCMVCVVRVKGKSVMVPSCATHVSDNMVVESDTEEVRLARRTALELLLGDHLGDCIGPCQSVCPSHMEIPLMIRQLAEGRYHDAIITVKQRIALPAILGRICPEICEKGCRRVQVDAAVGICRLKRFAADVDLESGNPYVPPCGAPSGKRVAIVGAGPSGLAAAYYLQQYGHACTIFDAHEKPGGQLRIGVPEELLPRTVIDAEVAQITRLGVKIHCGVRVDTVEKLIKLRDEYDAVFLALGEITAEVAGALGLAWAGRGLKVNRETGGTSLERVFAGGSAVSPSHQAIRACADGVDAADVIHQFVTNVTLTSTGETPVPRFEAPRRPYTVHIGKLHECEIAPLMEGPSGEHISAGPRITPLGGATAAFTMEEMQRETARCMHCDCLKMHTCALRRQAAEYEANATKFRGERREYRHDITHSEVVLEPGKCIDCGRCVAITQRMKEPLGLTLTGRGFPVRIAVPFGEPLAKGLTTSAEVVAAACPVAALADKEKSSVSSKQ